MLSEKESLILLLNYLFFDSPRQITYLASVFSSIEDFKANFQNFFKENSKRQNNLEFYLSRLNEFDLKNYRTELEKQKIKFIFFTNTNYPNALKELPDAPQILYYQGNINLLNTKTIGIVGSRNCSDYGEKVTRFFAQNLSPYFTICSGLARGLDAIAHNAVLEKSGSTIGVIASSLENISPKSNNTLFEKMRTQGLIISEYPLGIIAEGFRFHQRNRLIAALSLGVLVTEANEKSGTLITARYALEYGRDVFIVPSSIFNTENFGGLKLVQVGGGKIVFCINDILDEYDLKTDNTQTASESTPKKNLNQAEQLNLFLTSNSFSENAEKVLKLLNAEGPLNIDQLAIKTSEPLTKLLNSITELEMLDAIKILPGNKYQITV